MPPDPPVFAPQRILEVLARHEVLCVVIGGYAAVLAGVKTSSAARRQRAERRDLAALPLLRAALARQQP